MKRLVFALLIVICPSTLFAQTVLHFPRVISNGLVFTGIAVSNPTSGEVSVTFTAIQPDGTTLAGDGIQNPITVKIPAGGQSAKLFTEIFGNREFNGWVQATSSTKGLAGFFLNGNGALTDLDGAGSIESSAEFVLPLASEDATAKTEITIVNVNAEAASATVTLYNTQGQSIASKDLSLPGRGLVRQTLKGIFGDADLSAVSHAKIKSNRPLVGHEVVADFQVAGTTLRRETIALSGQPATSATAYVLPQFVTGGGWLSLVGLVNAGGVGQEVTLTAYKEDGTLWNVPANPKRISLEGNGAVRATASELFGFPAATLSLGWIEVRSSLGFLSSYIGFGNTLTPSFAVVNGTNTANASRYEVFSQVAEGANFFTGLTVVNPGKEQANIEFYTLRPDGTTVGRSTFTVGPNQRVGKLFSELLPASFEQVGGWGFLRSSQPVIGAVLFGSTNGFALANVPQQLPAGDFSPPEQKSGAISGSVRAGGELIGEVTITLSGPVTASRTTDSLGRYIFPQLPAGDYKVTAVRPGALFVPPEKSVSLKQTNMDDVNFEAGGLTPANRPVVEFISPTSTFAGNRAFSLRVLGGSFTPTSIIRLNDQPVLTTFVNSTELQAIIPATQLARAGTLLLTVETPPPGGGASTKFEFTINPVPQNPLLEARVSVGSAPAGVAIDTTRKTVLITNEADDAVTVLDLRTLEVKATIKVGRSPAEGIAIHRLKNIALVANPGTDDVSVIDLQANQETKKIKVGKFPVGVAINQGNNRAVVTNGQDNSISILDLDNLTVIGQINVGSFPQGVAIQPRFNQAVVTNSGSNSVSVIDLNANTLIGTIQVGNYPRGVAINVGTNVAVVANANSNTVSVIDLNSRTVAFTLDVLPGPTGVAIHEVTNTAIITSSGRTRGAPISGVAQNVQVLDIFSRQIVATVPSGSASFGVDIDQENQKAIVANFGSNDITILRVPNPRPRVDDVQPRTFPAGSGTFTITVRGTGFVPTSVVTLNGQSLPTTFVSPTELRAQITAAMLQQILSVRRIELDSYKGGGVFNQVTDLQFNINVSNPEPGGGESPPPVDPAVSRIVPQNAAPVLVSISPTEITAGTTDLALTLNGNNLNLTSVINFGNTQHSPSSANGTSASVTIPRATLSPGSVQVSITNPPPGGGTSGSLPFLVIAQPNPSPTVLRVNPSSIPAGSGAVAVTVEGSGFIGSTSASLGGVAGVVGSGTIQFNLTAQQTDNPGTLNGLVSNPAPGGGSASFTVNVLNVTPTITGFSPASAAAGSRDVEIRVTGTNFRAGTKITVNGTRLELTEFLSATALRATLPEGFLRRSGDVSIGVLNPPPGGGSAEGGTFTITSEKPALTAAVPPRGAIQQTDMTVRLTGSGFAGNSAAFIGNTRLASVFDSATQLTVTIPAALLAQAGVLSITVTNPPPGGGISEAIQFSVENPVPVLETVTPLRFRGDQRDVVMTVTGRNFVQGANIRIGELVFKANFVSATQLNAGPLPPPLPLGKQGVVVENPAPGGGASNAIEIEVTALLPVINSVTPEVVGLGQQIKVTGANFGPGSVVLVRGLVTLTRAISETELEATIPPTLAVGSAEVVVRNPSAATEILQSAAFTITIANPVPVIDSLEPSSALANHANQRIVIRGSGFIPLSTVQVDSNTVSSAYVDPVTITFLLPVITRGTSAIVQVINPSPGGGASNRATLGLTNVPPTVTAISPTSAQTGSTVPLSVNGANFVEGAAINFGSTTVATTFLSGNSLFANVAVGNSSGKIPVSVTNPGGATSNSIDFEVLAPPPPVIVLNPVPSISSVTPSTIAANAATSVQLSGSGFISTSSVLLDGNPLSSFTVSNTSTISAQLPALSAGSHAIMVSNPAPGGGSSNSFTITAGSVSVRIDSITPASGPIAGGTTVNLSGAGLSSSTQVYFNGVAATVTSAGSGAITVVTPPGATGFATVVAINGDKYSTSEFQYRAPAFSATAAGSVTTYAGFGSFRGENAAAATARLNQPTTAAFDSAGNLYFSDSHNHRIRKISTAGIVTTIAGTGVEGFAGDGGQAILAQLSHPSGVVFDAAGNLYVADSGNDRIRKITTDGVIQTFAGGSEMFHFLTHMVFDASGNLYAIDSDNHKIYKISTSGAVTTFAGAGSYGFSGDGGAATAATFSYPASLAFDSAGNLYVSDQDNQRIRKITSAGVISTFAGTGSSEDSGDGGPALSAGIEGPAGLLFDSSTNSLLVASGGRHVRKIDLSSGVITAFAGADSPGFSGDGGAATSARLQYPAGLARNSPGDIFIVEHRGNRIRKVSGGVISTVAGLASGAFLGDGGAAVDAGIDFVFGTFAATDTAGNVYIADRNHHRVRKIDAAGNITTFAGTGVSGFSGDGGSAASAQLNFPTGLAVDKTGNLYVSEANHRVRKITTSGVISTVAGTGTSGFSGDGGPAASAALSYPLGLAFDSAGNLHIVDSGNERIRKVDSSTGVISTIAGGGNRFNFAFNEATPATTVNLNEPVAIAFDATGVLYFTDESDNRVYRITPDGILTTVAGTGEFNETLVGPALEVGLAIAEGLATDPQGNLYISQFDGQILKVSPSGSLSRVTATTEQQYDADGYPAASTFVDAITGIAFDSNGNLFFVDGNRQQVRVIKGLVTVNPISGILPATLAQGQIVSGVITGKGLNGATAVSFSGAGVTASVLSTSDTEIRLQIIAASGAAVGGRAFTVTVGTGSISSGSVVLTIDDAIAAPSITAIAPGSGPTAGGNSVTITGTGFHPRAQVTIHDARAPIVSISSTQIAVKLPAGENGGATIVVRNPDGSSAQASYVYTSPALTSLTAGQVTTFAGTGRFRGDGGLATGALLDGPASIVLHSNGSLFIADQSNNRIRRVTPDGNITTFLSNISRPSALAIDGGGNLLIAEQGTRRILKATMSRVVTVAAGTGNSGNSGDGGPAVNAAFKTIIDLAVDSTGNIYVVDQSDNRVRKIDTSGVITAFAGTGTAGFSGDGAAATAATLNSPAGIAVDASGNVYISDRSNFRIRKVSGGNISTFAGTGSSSTLNPNGLFVDASGNVFVGTFNTVKKITSAGTISTIAGTGSSGSATNNVAATSSRLSLAQDVAVASDGATIYIADLNNDQIYKIDTAGTLTFFAGLGATGLGDNGPANLAVLNLAGSNTSGIVIGLDGNVIFADTGSHRIRKINVTTGIITTIAGTGEAGLSGDGGAATSAKLSFPNGLAIDGAGNLYIADAGNSRVRKIDTSGIITTVAGGGTGGSGSLAASASIFPVGLAIDGNGVLYIAESNRVRTVDRFGVLNDFAGTGTSGFAGDGGQAALAQLSSPRAVAIDAQGNVYIADAGNRRIRKVAPNGVITTFAGNGNSSYSGDGGPAANASFVFPRHIVIDAAGNVFVVDSTKIRKINTSGTITTVLGGFTYFSTPDQFDFGPAVDRNFGSLFSAAIDSSGNLFVSDFSSRIRVIKSVATGSAITGIDPGFGLTGTTVAAAIKGSNLAGATGVTFSGSGVTATVTSTSSSVVNVSITIASSAAPGLRTFTVSTPSGSLVSGAITFSVLLAGPVSISSVSPASGPQAGGTSVTITGSNFDSTTKVRFNHKNATVTSVNATQLVVTAPAPSTGGVYTIFVEHPNGSYAVADYLYEPPAFSSLSNGQITTIAGKGRLGGEGQAAVNATLNYPNSIAKDSAGNVYIADISNGRVRKIQSDGKIVSLPFDFFSPSTVAIGPAGLYVTDASANAVYLIANNTITLVAGGRYGFTGDGGPAKDASLANPSGLAIDSAGNIYISDSFNNRIRKVTSSDGRINTIAGTGTAGFGGDGGPATSAQLNNPSEIRLDGSGNLLIADFFNHRIRKVLASDGNISTIAGTGVFGYSGDGGAATSAKLANPQGVAVNSAGEIFIADESNSRIRKISTSGTITTVVGNGNFGFSGDGGAAASAELAGPSSVFVDSSGNLLIADLGNHRVRQVASGTITTIAGLTLTGDGGPATLATLATNSGYLVGLAFDGRGNVYFSDTGNHRVRKIDSSGNITTFAGSVSGYAGDGGQAVDAKLRRPGALAFDAAGNLYIADTYAIRRVTPAGVISTVAGNGSFGNPAGAAAATNGIGSVRGLAVDKGGGIYFADFTTVWKFAVGGTLTQVASGFRSIVDLKLDSAGNVHVLEDYDLSGLPSLKKIGASGTTSLAGAGGNGFAGDGGAATAAKLSSPTAIALDNDGNIYIADRYNYRIRQIDTAGTITTVAGSLYGFTGDGGSATTAYLSTVSGVGVDPSGNLYIADSDNARIRAVKGIAAAASITSISKTSLKQGETITATIAGVGLSGATAVAFGGTGLTTTVLSGGTGTSLPIQIVAASNATLGLRTFVVAGSAVLIPSGSVTVEVTVGSSAPIPTISSMIPAQRVVNSGGFTMDVFGTNFAAGSKVVFGGSTYTATFVDAQHLVVNIAGSDITALGSVNVKVSVPDSATPGTLIDSANATFTVIAPAITLSPNPVSANIGGKTPVTVSVNQAVTVSGGIDIAVSSNATSIATVATPARIAQGEAATTVDVTGVGVGSATLTASLSGYTSGTTAVNVTATAQPVVNVTPSTLIMSAAGSGIVTVSRANSSNVVPLDVTLSVNRAGYFNFPATVTIQPNQGSATVTLNGISADPTPPVTLSASAAGHNSGSTSQITVKILRIQMTPAVLVNPGQTTNIQIVLSDPAPAGGVTISLSSAATGTATVTPTVTIAAGSTQGTGVVTGVAAGNTTITASAAGFPNTTALVQVQNVNLSFVPSSGTFFTGSTYAKTITLTLNVAAVEGGQVVNLGSSDTALATVPATVTIPGGSSAVNVTVTGVGPGNATITASSPGLNSGTFAATLIAPTFRVQDSEGPQIANTGVRRLHYVRISNPAPIGGIPVTITSSDPAKLKVGICNTADPQDTTCNETASPQNSVTLTVPTGQNYVRFDIIGQDVAQDEVRIADPTGIVRDSAGNVYISEYGEHLIRKIDGATGLVSIFAGTGAVGITGDGGLATTAKLSGPTGLAIFNGELYVADYAASIIRKINLGTNIISTVVSSGLSLPYEIAFNNTGDLFIASWSSRKIFKFSGGSLTTVVGGGSASVPPTTVGVAATTLNAGNTGGVAVDDDGNVYYSDYSSHIVNQVDTSGVVRRVAGNGTAGESGDLADATAAQIRNPIGLALDKVHRILYILELGNDRIVKVTLNAVQPPTSAQPISRVAGGSGGGCCNDGLNARFSKLNGAEQLSVDADGNVLVGDRSNRRVREISFATGIIDTLIGSGTYGITGDGQTVHGTHLMITGPGFIPQRVPIDINQSQWQIISLTTTQTLGVPFNFTVRQSSNERMADSTTVTMTPLSPFTLNSPLTIPINGQTATATATPAAAGSGQIRIEANGTRFLTTSSAVVTVLPPATPALLIDDQRGRIDTATGVRRRHYVRLPASAGAGGVSVTVSVSTTGFVKVGHCNPSDPNDSGCTGAALGDSVTMTIPQNQNYAYFDVAGTAAAFNDPQTNDPIAVHMDANGNLYVAEFGNYRVRKMTPAGVLSTVAGTGATGAISGVPGVAASAAIKRPIGLAMDSGGNLYIAAYDGYAILKVDTSGNISTVAGIAGAPGFVEGALGTGKLSTLYQVAAGPDDSLYIADYGNSRVRKVSGGVLSTIAGGGSGSTAALQQTFSGVAGVAVDPATSDVYISEQGAHKIWRVVQSTGAIELVAGTGSTGFNGDQADATQATVYSPAQLHIRGNFLYVADYNNARVRRIQINVSPRPITTAAGTTSGGFSGDGDLAIVAQMSGPWGVTTDAAGNLFVAERDNARVRKVNAADGKISTIAFSGIAGFAGDGSAARGVLLKAAVNTAGITYLPAENPVRVLQSQWQIINLGTSQSTTTAFTFQVRQSSADRMAANTSIDVTPTSTAPFTLTTPLTIANNGTTVTGTATPTGGGSGQIQVQATDTSFLGTTSAVVIVTPPITPPLLIDDQRGRIDTATGIRRRHYVRLPAAAGAGGVSVTVSVNPAGSVKVGPCNPSDPNDSGCTGAAFGDSVTMTIPQGQNYAYFDAAGQATSFTDTQTNDPIGVHVDTNGNLYIAEFGNYVVRKLNSAGVLSTVAGTGATGAISGVPGVAASATIKRPIGLATDSGGNLYIAAYDGYAILKVDTSGNISTVAGIAGSAGFAEGALGTGKLSTLYQVAVGPDDSLYIADYGNSRVRKVTGGVLSTIAGGGSGSTAALQQTFSGVAGVAVDPATSDVYISEQGAHKIWRVVQSTGAIELVAGTGSTGFNGDQADATQATVYSPAQLHIRGNFLYVADYNNARIRKIQINVSPRPIVTVAGTTSAGMSGDGDLAIVAQMSGPWGVTTDAAGNLFVAERDNARVRKVQASDSKIVTVVGSGVAGYAGDGGGGRGVTLKAMVNTAGLSYLPAENTVRVLQSQWQIISLGTSQLTTTPFTFTVRQSSADRMAADTTINMTATAGAPFTLSTPLTLSNNGSNVTATATPTGNGSGQVIVQATGTSFLGTTSNVVTVLPPVIPMLTIQDSLGPRMTATGVRNRTYVRLPAAAPAGGVTVNVTSSDASRVAVATCNTTNYQDSTCQGGFPGAGITLNIPQGQNYAYFDLAGITSAFSDTRTNDPIAVHIDANGNLYVAEFGNYVVRKLSAAGVLSTIAGTGATGTISGVPGVAASATIKRPIGLATDSTGNLYIAAYDGYAILKVDSSGNISHVAGVLSSAGFADGALGTGKLSTLYQVAVGPDDSLYIADYGNSRVRKVTGGVLSTIAGGGSGSTAALQKTFSGVAGVAVDPATSDVYISEQGAHKIWRVVQSTGAIELVAGTGSAGFNGDQADATQAELYTPAQLHIRGNFLYVADYNNARVRKIQINVSPRPITTVAGTTTGGFSGDGDLAIVAQMNGPWGVTTDSAGNVFIAERDNARIRKVTAADGKITTAVFSGTAGYAGDGGTSRGVTIKAEVAAGGPNYLPAVVSTRVNQSTWEILNLSSFTQSGPTFTFDVRQAASELSDARMNQATSFSLLSTNGVVLSLPADLTIADNVARATGTATTAGAGIAQIVAQSSATGIAQGASSNITIQPVITSVSPSSGPANATTPVVLNGRNLITATAVTAPAGMTATITGGTSTALNVNVVVGSVTSGPKTLTLKTPGGDVTFTFTVN